MANKIDLIEWLLSQKDRVDFNVTEYTWIEDFAPEYSDFGVTLGQEIGRAIDKDGEISLTKAIAEAIERTTCVHNGFTKSTGIAAHPDKNFAFENARRELIERVAFDLHFSQRIPFMKWEPRTMESKRSTATFTQMGIQFSFFKLISPLGFNVICAAALGENYARPFGAMFGFGCHEDSEQAELAALFELLRNAANCTHDEDIESLSVADFQKIPSPKFFDRFRLALNVPYSRKISFLFGGQGGAPEAAFPFIEIRREELAKPPELESAPITVMQAVSNYQFGGTSDALPSFMG